MPTALSPSRPTEKNSTTTMRALVFRGPNQIAIERVPIPRPGPGEAVIRVTLTTICGTDLHIVKGEYPVKAGLVIGHEPVGVRVRGWRARPSRRDHAVRAMRLLPRRRPRAVRRAYRRLEIWQLYQRSPGRISPGSQRPGQSGQNSR